MIAADEFCARLIARGFTAATGVPCSYFAGPIEWFSREGRYVPAANEGAALALAAGASLGGVRTVVFAQNSGLGNLINPLASLHMTYDIPALVFVSLRGWPDPSQDEPQHAVMGRSTEELLDTLGAPRWLLSATDGDLDGILDAAEREMSRGRTAFVLVGKGAIGGAVGGGGATLPARGTRTQVLRAILPDLADVPIISTTGYTSRDLFALGDADNRFYMQGSMGHALAIGLGLSRTLPEEQRVVVLDGDGAALMHLGTMSTIGSAGPANLVHILFDNNSYESTGSQATTSSLTNFVEVGLGCGYRTARECSEIEEVRAALSGMLTTPGPHLLVVGVTPGSGTPSPRATSASSAPEIHRRFRTWVSTRPERSCPS